MATEEKVYVEQEVLRINLNTNIDLTGQTVLKIKAESPSNVRKEFSGFTDDEAAGLIYHDIEATDITEAGNWQFWSFATLSGKNIIGDAVTIRFYNEGE